MNRDDIIRMAQECGLIGMRPHLDGIYEEALQRFAAIVADAEREACAAFLESGVDLSGLAGDRMMQAFTGKLLIGCAAAIRSRKQ